MKARAYGCRAIRINDQMQCAKCGLSYDVNDPDPPECRPLRTPLAKADRHAAAARQGIAELRRLVAGPPTENKP